LRKDWTIADWTLSVIGRAAILTVALVGFSSSTRPAHDVTDWMPVNIVSASDETQITAGEKTAPKAETPKPLVEKVGDNKRVDDSTTKVAEKEVKAARETQPEPQVQPTEKPQHEIKPDPIAETLQKEKIPEPKPVAAKTPTPPRKPHPPAPKYDPKQIEALLDKRDATRVASAGETLNNTPSLGLANGHAAEISQNELQALQDALSKCWTPPAGIDRNSKLNVIVRVLLKLDGTVAKPPLVVSGPASLLGAAMAESATRAVLRCQPFRMLKPEHYEHSTRARC
jgi:colicin import membrane protein